VIGLLPGPEVGRMLMAPPLVDIVADAPFATEIASGDAAPVVLSTDTAPPDVTTEELAAKFSDGAMRFNALPPFIVKVVPAARFIEPGPEPFGMRLRTSTKPLGPALNL